MNPRHSYRAPLLAALALALSSFALSTPARSEETRPVRASLAPPAGAALELENIAGTLRVVPASGPEILIEGTVHAESAALADQLKIELAPAGDRVVARLTYPLSEHQRYVYPSKSDGGFFSGLSQSSGKFQGREVTVYSGSRSGAVLLYCDLVVHLPAAHAAKLRTIVGSATAEKVRGDLSLDTGSGDVAASDNSGALAVDTGSGDVKVARQAGKVAVDTGSGDVDLAEVTGDVTVDTGSGSIVARKLRGERASFDTGSGDVTLEAVSASLLLDTGSGSITGRAIEAGAEVTASTGSGDVQLAGDFSRVRKLAADTGSGDVTFESTGTFPALRFEVSTASGGVDVNLPSLSVLRSKHGDFAGQVGDGNAGTVHIDTGSGDVTVRSAAR